MRTQKSYRTILLALGALMATSACCLIPGAAAPPATLTEASLPTITGTATYRERMMAPPGAALNVELADTSRADAAAVRIGAWSAPLDGKSVPQRFTLLPTAPLDPRFTYTVRATINAADGALLWTTDTVNRVPVSAAASIDVGELVMVKVAAPATAVPVLAGSTWKLDGLGGVGLVSGREPTLTFTADGKINGSTGCNRFFGSYAQDGAALTFSGAGSTKMACTGEGLMEQEAAFLSVLSSAATLSSGPAGAVTITGANGTGFVARPDSPAPVEADPALLLGAAWIVEDINRGGVIDNTRLTLTFGEDGRVSGSGGCNGFSGTYTAAGASVTFGPLMMTRRACAAPSLNAQEQRYTNGLTGTLTWIVNTDGALELTGDDGARVLLRR